MRYVRAPRQRRISALLRCAELASRNLELEAEAKSLRAMVLRKEAVLQQAQRSLHLCQNPALALARPNLALALPLVPSP